jgi:hypothetical protein
MGDVFLAQYIGFSMRLTIPCTDICGPEENSPFHLANAVLIPLKREKKVKKSKDIGVKIFLYIHYPPNCEREREREKDFHRGGIPDP